MYNVGVPDEFGVGPRCLQDLLQEGDTSYDIDTLNPSLTDLPLQGNTVTCQQDSEENINRKRSSDLDFIVKFTKLIYISY